MIVLVACEESQEVCKAFRDKGHEAYSCDIVECSGGHPEWHINFDCIDVMWSSPFFWTVDGQMHCVKKWDLIIAHPPCTYLSVAGNSWFNIDKYGDKAVERYKLREEAIDFFLKIAYHPCEKIAIENPIGCMSTRYRKPDQIIQPYQFGHPCRKPTCLWLKNLPPLKPTNIVEPIVIKYKNGKGTDDTWHMDTLRLPAEERRKARSKTFHGIALAMADQWG